MALTEGPWPGEVKAGCQKLTLPEDTQTYFRETSETSALSVLVSRKNIMLFKAQIVVQYSYDWIGTGWEKENVTKVGVTSYEIHR
jgi:hypothetical protein